MRHLRSKLSGDAAAKAELRDIISIYNRPGGVAAWAQSVREEEAEASASLSRARSSRGADLAGPLPAVQPLAPERSDVESPGSSIPLTRLARMARLNEAYLAAAAAGDAAGAETALRGGADPEAVDMRGQGAGDIAREAGHAKAAHRLGERMLATIDARVLAGIKSAERALAPLLA